MIGIIILTKNNDVELFKCLDSIKETTNSPYRIYIGDTGSTKQIKKKTKNKLKSLFKGKFKFIEFSGYNFAKNNNTIVQNHLHDDVDILIFCNNDVEIKTKGTIDRIAEIIKSFPNEIGTCGCRLVFGDGRIQHDGQNLYLTSNMNHPIVCTHHNLKRHSKDIAYQKPLYVQGITFALCGTPRKLFNELGKLPENYIDCFEDVEYNLNSLIAGRKNILIESKYWAYHYESTTRKKSKDFLNKLKHDCNALFNYVYSHYGALMGVLK